LPPLGPRFPPYEPGPFFFCSGLRL
jgi:hypothetical protein